MKKFTFDCHFLEWSMNTPNIATERNIINLSPNILKRVKKIYSVINRRKQGIFPLLLLGMVSVGGYLQQSDRKQCHLFITKYPQNRKKNNVVVDRRRKKKVIFIPVLFTPWNGSCKMPIRRNRENSYRFPVRL